jgi:hypothetical protein
MTAEEAKNTNHLYEISKFNTTLKINKINNAMYNKRGGNRINDFSKSPSIKYINDR